MIRSRTKRRDPEWRPGKDYRIVCDCQRHARQERSVLRRTMHAASRAAAVLIGVPLAVGALDLPMKAMNVNLSTLVASTPMRGAIEMKKADAKSFPIFTTPLVREQFLPAAPPAALTVDAVKEEFFRTQVPYGAIIYREAKRNNLPPELVAAVVQTESDFRPRLVSHKSAQGLMQIVPSTARILGVGDPFNPEQNIAAGTKYLKYLFERFEDQNVALAAYNAGEGNVERFGGVPPFAETRGYLEKVSARTFHYRQRVRNTYIASARMRRAALH